MIQLIYTFIEIERWYQLEENVTSPDSENSFWGKVCLQLKRIKLPDRKEECILSPLINIRLSDHQTLTWCIYVNISWLIIIVVTLCLGTFMTSHFKMSRKKFKGYGGCGFGGGGGICEVGTLGWSRNIFCTITFSLALYICFLSCLHAPALYTTLPNGIFAVNASESTCNWVGSVIGLCMFKQ